MVDYYDSFRNLHGQKGSLLVAQKSVFLLSIIEMVESNELSSNEIRFNDQIRQTFSRIWNQTFPYRSISSSDTFSSFWDLRHEPFWHIIPQRNKEYEMPQIINSTVVPSEDTYNNVVKYVELDENLFFLMTLPTARRELKEALLETYTNLSAAAIELRSRSDDTSIDNSQIAVAQYKEMLASNQRQISTDAERNESHHSFNKLSDTVQIILYVEYYSFLLKNPAYRSEIRSICPDVFTLYELISECPVCRASISADIYVYYLNFLKDLKIALIREDSAIPILESLDKAIECLEVPDRSEIEIQDTNDENSSAVEAKSNKQQEDYASKEEAYVTIGDNSKLPKGEEDLIAPNSTLPSLPAATHIRNGAFWQYEEERKVVEYFNLGYPIDEIAKSVGRTEVAIKMRLAKVGLIEYSYGDDTYVSLKDPFLKSARGYIIENTASRSSILDSRGSVVYTECEGKLLFFHDQPYRFNYKQMCFTVKDIIIKNDNWIKGRKRLVAYAGSDLYNALIPNDFISQIKDIVCTCNWEDTRIRIMDEWYDYQGHLIKNIN